MKKYTYWFSAIGLSIAIVYLIVVGYLTIEESMDKSIIVLIRPDGCDPMVCDLIHTSAASFANDMGYDVRVVYYNTSIQYPGVYILGIDSMSMIEAIDNPITLQQYLCVNTGSPVVCT